MRSSAMSVTPKRRSLGQILLAPAIVAILTASGLMSALLGDGLWDAFSWLALLVPVATLASCVWQYRVR
jgi:hypothetical protein